MTRLEYGAFSRQTYRQLRAFHQAPRLEFVIPDRSCALHTGESLSIHPSAQALQVLQSHVTQQTLVQTEYYQPKENIQSSIRRYNLPYIPSRPIPIPTMPIIIHLPSKSHFSNPNRGGRLPTSTPKPLHSRDSSKPHVQQLQYRSYGMQPATKKTQIYTKGFERLHTQSNAGVPLSRVPAYGSCALHALHARMVSTAPHRSVPSWFQTIKTPFALMHRQRGRKGRGGSVG